MKMTAHLDAVKYRVAQLMSRCFDVTGLKSDEKVWGWRKCEEVDVC
jgi:hypothetical protein